MAGPVELRGVDAGRTSQPVERVVPGQRVRPFVAEHLDGLRLTKIAVELDHKPLIPTKALAQDRFGEPGRRGRRRGWPEASVATRSAEVVRSMLSPTSRDFAGRMSRRTSRPLSQESVGNPAADCPDLVAGTFALCRTCSYPVIVIQVATELESLPSERDAVRSRYAAKLLPTVSV